MPPKQNILTKRFRKKVIDEVNKFSSFTIFIALYFIFFDEKGDPLISTALKCAPIISLGLYVITKGFKCSLEFNYSQMVLSGLFFSCIGDSLLNLDLFPYGMAVFGIAQGFYISAFELKPWNIAIGIPLYVIAGGMTYYIFNSLGFVMKIGLPIYAFLLTTMCWRAIVRAVEKKTKLAITAAVGSILFVISDTLISLTMFIQPIRYGRVLVMLTYYAAQFCIALSTLSDVIKPQKAKGSKKLCRKFRDQDYNK